jgi:hypothetical protein
MKTFFLITAVLFYTADISAQNSFGIRVAYNNTTATKASENIKTNSLNRFQVGVFGKRYVLNNWFVKANFIYNQKGNFYDDNPAIADAGKTVTIKLNYIETSIDLGYTVKITGRQRVDVAAGPYFAYGINGTEKGYGETLLGPIVIDRKVDFTNSQTKEGTDLRIKPVDVGLNFNIAYQYRKYGMVVNYGLGLTNREVWGKSFNRVTSIGISYSFK